MDLTELLRHQAGKTLAFQHDLSPPEPFLRSTIAFANTAGGTILIGVEDGTRHVRGVPGALATAERAANLVLHAVSPHLLPDIALLLYRDTHVLAVHIHPSPDRPHHLGPSPETGAYVRVGSTNRRADADLLAEMRRFARGQSFDEQPMAELSSEAVDFRAASESFAEYRKLTDRDLDILGVCTTDQARRVPTVGGMLLFGRDRLRHFPDAWVQAGRFAGTDKADIVDRQDIKMPLPETIPAAIAFIERHIEAGVEIGHVRAEPRWTLPPLAVREAVVNAVAHADYSQRGAPLRIAMFDDRLEVENPGLLPFGITLEDLPRGVSKLRNRVIGRVFHELRLVEQWGSGVQRMLAACRDAGLRAPVWEEIGNRMRVTMWTERVGETVTDDIDNAILDALEAADGLGTRAVADVIGLSTRATRNRLGRLVERGLAVEVGTGPRDPKRKYHRAGS